ncbi:MAG: hypothetical protein H7122_11475 [Chitinophagaceae bacterium]|nr:hypothetical protein [Chitinophagaceae bacterium]
MRTQYMLISIFTVLGCGQIDSSIKSKDSTATIPVTISYSMKDLHKLKWIEGKWRGTHHTKPFYEIYRFANDSTLEIISYDWNGKDSSHSSKSRVYWKDGAYYLGDHLNWKVTEITDSSIMMLPNNKASNDILWKYSDSTSWDAILNDKKETSEYHMQAYDPFLK